MMDTNDGYYCTICGGIPPDKIKIKRILVDGKATGIDQLDWIVDEVKKLNLSDDAAITDELLKRTKVLQLPTHKNDGKVWRGAAEGIQKPGGNNTRA